MIQAGANDLLLHVTEFTVILGMFVMLFGLLVPREMEVVPAAESAIGPSGASSALAEMIAKGAAIHTETAEAELIRTREPVQAAAPPPVEAPQAASASATVSPSTFAAIMAEAKRQVDEHDEPDLPLHTAVLDEEKTESGFDIEEMLRAPLVTNLAEEHPPAQEHEQPIVVDKTHLAKRITWPALVDDQAVSCDLPTRLRLIEALSFIGGSWAIDILARAYEQELDASVRGAIFVALRDARSAA